MSEIQDTCFKDFVGLSQNTCDCFGTPPSDFNVSRSGLFIDQVEGLNLRLADALDDCKDGSIWDILYNARQRAVRDVRADLIAGIAGANEQIRPTFQGLLGEFDQQSGYQIFSEVMVGRKWIMNPIRGGKVLVKGIWIRGDQNSTVNLGLYTNLDESLVQTIPLTVEANKWKYNTVNVVLPNFSDQVRFMKYFWIFAPSAASTPFNVYRNQVHCGCGGTSPNFNDNDPTFKDREANLWNAFLQDAGIRGDVFADRDKWQPTIAEAYGLRFDVQLYCNLGEVICTDALNFDSSPLPMTIANMINFRAAYYVATDVLELNEPDRQSMTGREQLEKNRNFYFNEYLARLAAAVTAFSTPENLRLFSDCYRCQDPHSFRKSKILA